MLLTFPRNILCLPSLPLGSIFALYLLLPAPRISSRRSAVEHTKQQLSARPPPCPTNRGRRPSLNHFRLPKPTGQRNTQPLAPTGQGFENGTILRILQHLHHHSRRTLRQSLRLGLIDPLLQS